MDSECSWEEQSDESEREEKDNDLKEGWMAPVRTISMTTSYNAELKGTSEDEK